MKFMPNINISVIGNARNLKLGILINYQRYVNAYCHCKYSQTQNVTQHVICHLGRYIIHFIPFCTHCSYFLRISVYETFQKVILKKEF